MPRNATASVSTAVDTVRYLISECTFDRSHNAYLLEVLRADSANLANRTGVGCTLVVGKGVVNSIRKFHELPKNHNLFGVPVLCSVTRTGSNVLGSSKFYSNVY